MSNNIDDNDVWHVVEAFFDEYGVASHQIESYNEMIENGIPNILSDNRIIEIEVKTQKYIIEFRPESIIYEKPQHKETSEEIHDIYPSECIRRNLTYESSMFIDIEVTNPKGDWSLHEKVLLAKIPVMTKSILCHLHTLTGGLTYKNMSNINEIDKELASLQEDIFYPGGTFIINGSQKAIASQERTAFNKTYVFAHRKTVPKYEYYSEVRSCSITGNHSTKLQIGILKELITVVVPYIEVSTIPIGVLFRALGAQNEKEMLSYILHDIKDEEMKELLLPSLEVSYECDSQDNALHFIGKRGKKFSGEKKSDTDKNIPEKIKERNDAISYASHLLSIELLPHLGTGKESYTSKKYYLGYMIYRLLNVKLKRAKLDDRDHFQNKRIATAGILLIQQTYNAFRKLKNEIITSVERSIRNDNFANIINLINSKTITNMLRNALTNNVWSTRGKCQGISQQYEDYNYVCGITNLRKIVTPIDEGGKVDAPRKLHGSHWGIIGPYETPEGKKCGLIKHMAATALITIGSDTHVILEILKTMNIIQFRNISSPSDYNENNNQEEENHESDNEENNENNISSQSRRDIILSPQTGDNILQLVKVFANGVMFGVTNEPENIVDTLRQMRRSGDINQEISVYYDAINKEIHISSEFGRMCRPLFIVENNKLLFTKEHVELIKSGSWDEPSVFINLLTNGIIEIIDKSEEENTLVALYPSELEQTGDDTRRIKKYTHCEIHPSMILGISDGLIPFANMDQSPRVTYQSSMFKQGIGIPGTNYSTKNKGKIFVLDYPQKPLTTTRLAKIIGYDQMPTAVNAVVFVCPWFGFGQEDSIIINQDFIERGGLTATGYFSYEAIIRVDKKEKLEIPVKGKCVNFKGNPSKLDLDSCIVPIGTLVKKDDILIGITMKIDDEETLQKYNKIDRMNKSVIYDHQFDGRVYNIEKNIDGKGYAYIRVTIAQKRDLIYGDKCAAMHGQKGTVGMIYRSIDLPVTEDGLVPDIMINPLALPSRMTIGMLVEMLSGKKICATSKVNSIQVKKVFQYDKENGDPSEGKMDKMKFKTPRGGYSIFKNDSDCTSFNKSFNVMKNM